MCSEINTKTWFVHLLSRHLLFLFYRSRRLPKFSRIFHRKEIRYFVCNGNIKRAVTVFTFLGQLRVYRVLRAKDSCDYAQGIDDF